MPFVAATLFFTVFPFLSLLATPPAPAAFVLLLAGWAIFAGVVVGDVPQRAVRAAVRRTVAGRLAVVAMVAIAVIAQVVFGAAQGSALYFYAGGTAARLEDERLAVGGIAAAGRRGAPRDRLLVGRLEHRRSWSA